MPYGTLAADTLQSSTGNTAPVFKDGNSVEIGKLARAWMNYNGTSPNVYSSFNISSVTKNAGGNYSVNYSIAMPNANKAIGGSTDYIGVTVNTALTLQNNVGAGTGALTVDQILGIAYDGSLIDNTGINFWAIA